MAFDQSQRFYGSALYSREGSLSVGRRSLSEGNQRYRSGPSRRHPNVAIDVIESYSVFSITEHQRLLGDDIQDVVGCHERPPATIGGNARSC